MCSRGHDILILVSVMGQATTTLDPTFPMMQMDISFVTNAFCKCIDGVVSWGYENTGHLEHVSKCST